MPMADERMSAKCKARKPPPPRPKRISSAKPDTVNRQDDSISFDSGFSDIQNNNGASALGEVSYGNEQIVNAGSMGSSPSIQATTRPSLSSQTSMKNDLLTLSHAPVLETAQNENQYENSYNVPTCGTKLSHEPMSIQDEMTMVHRAPIKPLQFKHSTFKGTSMSAVTMSRNSPEKQTPFHPQKGKYEFARSSFENADYLKPSTIKSGSIRSHESNSPDLLFTSSKMAETKIEEPMESKAALVYGTLRKSNSSGSYGSVTELFKSKVRNSFRNSKFFSRNLATEEKDPAASLEVPPSSVELYDPTLPYPDDFRETEDNWMSLSHDSGALFHHKAQSSRIVLPVQIPSLERENIYEQIPTDFTKNNVNNNTKIADTSFLIDMTNKTKTRHRDGHTSPGFTFDEQNRSTIVPNFQTFENVSAEASECNSTSFSSKSTSQSSLTGNSKTAEEESIEILDGVIQSHSSESRYVTMSTIKSALSFRSEVNITLGGDDLHGTVEPKGQESNLKTSLAYSPSNNQKPPMHPSTSEPKIPKSQKLTTSPLEGSTNFLAVEPTNSKLNSLVLQDHINVSDKSLAPNGSLYGPSSNASIPSGKITPKLPTDLPDIHGSSHIGHAPSTVVPGLSITDVLSQEYTTYLPPDSTFLNNPPLRLNSSFKSQISTTYDTNSFDDDSSTSFSGSQEYVLSEDAQEILSNDGTIKKTGWLITKHLLIQKRGKLEKPGRRKWRKYWVNLKGDRLLFYVITDGSMPEDTDLPVLTLSVGGALVQPVPEHVTRDNVMCISCADGSTYLLQANTQTEVDGWIQAIHVEAATLVARNLSGGEESTRKNIKNYLKQEIDKMKHEIEEDEKMRKMAELQMSLVTDVKSKKAITDQILKWEENAEKNQVHVFRLRCYLSSLEGTEQPNPRLAISAVCKTSKQLLSTLKLFNITTLHSLVASKQQSLALSSKKRSFNLNLKRSGSFTGSLKDDSSSVKSSPSKPKKSSIFGSLRGFDTWRGSSSSVSGGKKKKHHHRPSVSGIISAFTSSSNSSSLKDSDTNYGNKKRVSAPAIVNSDVTIRKMEEQFSTPGTVSEDDITDGFNSVGGSLDSLLLAPPDAWCVPIESDSSSVRVSIGINDFINVTMTYNMTFRQLLEIVCRRRQLDSNDHYLVGEGSNGMAFAPTDNDLLSEVKCERLKVKKKRSYSVDLESNLEGFGFSVLPKALCCPLVVDIVSPGGKAESVGLQNGEEILIINGELTAEMNEDDAQKSLENGYLRLLVRTRSYEANSRLKTWWPNGNQEDDGSNPSGSDTTFSHEDKERSRSEHLMAVLEDYLNKIVVPPPPVTSNLQPSFIRSPFSSSSRLELGKKHGSIEDIMNLLVVPPPEHRLQPPPEFGSELKESENGNSNNNNHASILTPKECDALIDNLLQKSEAVTALCRRLMSHDYLVNQSESSYLQQYPNDIQKIWKVLHELVDTERNYVKDLDCLLKRFLEPLHSEGMLDVQDIDSLLRSVQRILNFQRTFLDDLTEALAHDEVDSFALNRSLLSVTSSFLQHAAQFKLYAVFSTCHTVAQDIIEQAKSESSDIRIFLEARNPKHQHSLSLDSYLIKPIQRVLKYPLLIRELLSLSESIDVVSTKARNRLRSALHAMHAVARHINDTQTVHDEFGSQGFIDVMDHASEYVGHDTTMMLNLNELLCYCKTEWTNSPDEVNTKIKKGNIIEALIFVFQKAVVVLCRGIKHREKKKATPQHDSAPNLRSSVQTEFIHSDFIHGTELSVDENFSENKLEILNKVTSQSYQLCCDSLETKQRIVKTVRYVIKDCARSLKDCTDSLQSSETPLDDGTPSVENFAMPGESTADKDTNINVKTQNENLKSDQSDSDIDSNSVIKIIEPTARKKQREFFYRPNEGDRRGSEAHMSDAITDLKNSILPSSGSVRSASPIPIEGAKRLTESPTPPSDKRSELKVPMTLPLPTYEVAVSNIMASSESLKSPNLRSGLWISSAPASIRSYNTGSNRSLVSSSSKDSVSESTKIDSYADKPESSIHDCQNMEQDNKSSKWENVENKSHNNIPKMSKNGSPARYNMVYGVAPFESKL
ncbi:uncharacterized protein LOC120345627 isoform X2 [Styela clava]